MEEFEQQTISLEHVEITVRQLLTIAAMYPARDTEIENVREVLRNIEQQQNRSAA